MADEQTPAAEQQPQAPLTINSQYVKDLSLEVPHAPGIFGELQSAQPDINIDITVNARQLTENAYEVTLGINTNCKVGEHVGFIMELLYAGMFTLHVPEEHRSAILLIECPRLLFPSARNIVADVTRDGGFPPVMLGIVDFVQMYQNRAKAEQASATEKTE